MAGARTYERVANWGAEITYGDRYSNKKNVQALPE
jgi:hypothetical protein